MTVLSQSNSERIRQLNDGLRQTFTGGTVVLTEGVDALSAEVKAEVLLCVRSFDRFDRDNDPHGEHDFGSFEIADQRFFFKVDYYNLEMDGGSEDPADPAKTTRVLTVMKAEEY
jgi:Protein of unknown function (DUF3768)